MPRVKLSARRQITIPAETAKRLGLKAGEELELVESEKAIVLVPRKHIPSLDDLSLSDAATVGTTLVKVAQIARDLHLNSDGYRVVANHGDAAGQTVFHIHFHLLGGRNFGWPPG